MVHGEPDAQLTDFILIAGGELLALSLILAQEMFAGLQLEALSVKIEYRVDPGILYCVLSKASVLHPKRIGLKHRLYWLHRSVAADVL